jgi:adenylate cyclase
VTTEERAGRRSSLDLLRGFGVGALQVVQAFVESRGRALGDVELTIVFTDLAGFSSWAVAAGDDRTVALLRAVARVVEPAMAEHGGEIVKRLGDGLMVIFTDAQQAFDAVVDARAGLTGLTVDGYRPRLRVGVHTGRPRRLGGDYLGVDVNIAARLTERAGPGQILASKTTVDALDPAIVRRRRKKSFTFRPAKGVPDGLAVYVVAPRDD